MLVAETVTVENPILTDCRSPSGTHYWKISFDVKLLGTDGNAWLVLLRVAVARGYVLPSRGTVGGRYEPVNRFNGPFTAELVEALYTIGWPERYPGVVWPVRNG